MKFSTVLLIAGAALVAAQDLAALPDCSKACATKLLTGSNCGIDPKCICSNKAFLSDIATCVATDCKSEADRAATVAFAVEICKAVDIVIDTTLPSASSTSSSSSSTSTAATTTVDKASPTTKSTASSSPSGAAGGNNGTISTPKPTDKPDESAGKAVRSSLIGVIGALAAAVALL